MKRAKIVCTIGPACRDEPTLERMALAGMDVARLNMGHGDRATHAGTIAAVRRVSERVAREIAVLVDLSGPKIRLGRLNAPLELRAGDEVTLLPEGTPGEPGTLPVRYPFLARELEPGGRMSLSDGLIQLEALRIEGGAVHARVLHGGTVLSGKGVNLPGGGGRLPALTAEDAEDLRFALAEGADWVGMSYVRTGADADAARRVMAEEGRSAPLIAKIEKRQAMENLDGIVAAFDGVMVARGDLGAEVPVEELPLLQRRIIRAANRAAKPVITATQMFLSMVSNPSPTRAEVSDVANAVADGTDAVMLSEETAVGAHPVEAVRMMALVADRAEGLAAHSGRPSPPVAGGRARTAEAIAHATRAAASEAGAKLIVTPTTSGSTARLISAARPAQPILALSPERRTVRALALSWGVAALLVPEPADTDDLFAQCREAALAAGLAGPGDLAVVTAGVPLNETGTTNLLRILTL